MSQTLENWQRVVAVLANEDGKMPLTPTDAIRAIESVLEQHSQGLITDHEAELYLDLFGGGLAPTIISGDDEQLAICWGVPDDKRARGNWIELGKFLHRMATGFPNTEDRVEDGISL